VASKRESVPVIRPFIQYRTLPSLYDHIPDTTTTTTTPLSCHPPSIHHQNLPRNIARRTTRQENHRPPKLLRPTPPPSWNSLRDRIVIPRVRIRPRIQIHIRGDIPRRNGIDSDPMLRPLVAQRFRQLADSALAARVGGHVDPALKRRHAGCVDDAAFDPAIDPVSAGVPAEREDGAEVRLHDLVEGGLGEMGSGETALDPRGVDQDVEGVGCCDAGDEVVDFVFEGEVLGEDMAFAVQ
jgi:hypothetical protein